MIANVDDFKTSGGLGLVSHLNSSEFNKYGIITMTIFESKHPYITSFKKVFLKSCYEF